MVLFDILLPLHVFLPQTDDEDAEDTGMEDEGADGGAAGGGGRAGGAGVPSCVIEEVE